MGPGKASFAGLGGEPVWDGNNLITGKPSTIDEEVFYSTLLKAVECAGPKRGGLAAGYCGKNAAANNALGGTGVSSSLDSHLTPSLPTTPTPTVAPDAGAAQTTATTTLPTRLPPSSQTATTAIAQSDAGAAQFNARSAQTSTTTPTIMTPQVPGAAAAEAKPAESKAAGLKAAATTSLLGIAVAAASF